MNIYSKIIFGPIFGKQTTLFELCDTQRDRDREGVWVEVERRNATTMLLITGPNVYRIGMQSFTISSENECTMQIENFTITHREWIKQLSNNSVDNRKASNKPERKQRKEWNKESMCVWAKGRGRKSLWNSDRLELDALLEALYANQSWCTKSTNMKINSITQTFVWIGPFILACFSLFSCTCHLSPKETQYELSLNKTNYNFSWFLISGMYAIRIQWLIRWNISKCAAHRWKGKSFLGATLHTNCPFRIRCVCVCVCSVDRDVVSVQVFVSDGNIQSGNCSSKVSQ